MPNPLDRPTAATDRARFLSRVELIPFHPCWIWVGAMTQWGYGVSKHAGKREHAHRVSWRLFNGEIPDGMCVLHRCDNPLCVRPDHLFLGTQADNMRDMTAKGRGNLAPALARITLLQLSRTHCKRGHPFTGANLVTRKRKGRPYRACRTCLREWNRVRCRNRRVRGKALRDFARMCVLGERAS